MPNGRNKSNKAQGFDRVIEKAGFEGPYSGSKNQFMVKGTLRLTIPNPHQSDIGVNLLSKIIKQAGLTKDEWDAL